MDFYLQQALDAVQRETDGLDAAQLAWHSEGKWSTAQILEHLSLAFSSTSKAMERRLQERRADARKPTLREWLIILIVVKIGFFPTGREAPEWTRPRGVDASQAVDHFRAALLDMDAKIAAAEAEFGSGIVAVHPIIGPLSAQQWRKFHWEHTRHHIKQIRVLRMATTRQQAASA